MLNLRIVQKEYADNTIIYVLEKQNPDGEWVSVYAHKDLEVIRELIAKSTRADRARVINETVIE